MTTMQSTDLHSLISATVELRKIAGTNGGEYAGPCPLCGSSSAPAGVDRLRVWPHATKPTWWCRHCEKGGDAIQWVRELDGVGYIDACALLKLDTAYEAAPAVIRPPEEAELPCEAWQAAGEAFAYWAEQEMTALPLAYLTDRGLTMPTIAQARIGYNPTDREASRAKWGLPQDKEHGDRFWIPAGIVIPWYVAGKLWKIQIRRDNVRGEQDRYKTVTGSSNALYGADTCKPGQPAILVEGPFDHLAVQQCAGDALGVAACGTSGARRARWYGALGLCSEVLIAFDADAAGDAAAPWWIDALAPRARRWRPWANDPSQMLQDGMNVRQWVLSGLGHAELPALTFTGEALSYWRRESRYGCAASMERLARICASRGASVAATVRGLA